MVTTTEVCEYMKAEIKEAEIKKHQTGSQINLKEDTEGETPAAHGRLTPVHVCAGFSCKPANCCTQLNKRQSQKE